jgi:hypothetical protein
MQEPLRELKCENDANVTSFCTMNPADAQFDLFEALGRNSQHPNRSRRNGKPDAQKMANPKKDRTSRTERSAQDH